MHVTTLILLLLSLTTSPASAQEQRPRERPRFDGNTLASSMEPTEKGAAVGYLLFKHLERTDDGWVLRTTREPYSGPVRRLYDDGSTWQEVTLKDGREHGTFTEWDAEGRIRGRAEYRDGKMHGTFVRFHPNGAKMSEFTYENGKPHGPATRWDPEGQVVGRKQFEHGKEIDPPASAD